VDHLDFILSLRWRLKESSEAGADRCGAEAFWPAVRRPFRVGLPTRLSRLRDDGDRSEAQLARNRGARYPPPFTGGTEPGVRFVSPLGALTWLPGRWNEMKLTR